MCFNHGTSGSPIIAHPCGWRENVFCFCLIEGVLNEKMSETITIYQFTTEAREEVRGKMTSVAVHLAHKRKDVLHGKHRTDAGTEDAKNRAWDEVASKCLFWMYEISERNE